MEGKKLWIPIINVGVNVDQLNLVIKVYCNGRLLYFGTDHNFDIERDFNQQTIVEVFYADL